MQNQTDKQPEKPASLMTERESVWFNLAISGATILVVLFIAGLTYAWKDIEKPEVFAARVDAIYKLALFGAALVTFCTVAWRGFVSIRQADAQVEATKNQTSQILMAQRQMELNERNELADLFQKGVQLLYSTNVGERAAGISTLEVVALNADKFSEQSLTQIVDRFQVCGSEDYDSEESQHARLAINNISDRTQIESNRYLRFESVQPKNIFWDQIKGVVLVQFVGGTVRRGRNTPMEWPNNCFRNTTVLRMTVKVEWPAFEACYFKDCHIIRISEYGDYHTFDGCEFSGCVVSEITNDLEFIGHNYYFENNPPVDIDGVPMTAEWLDARNIVAEPTVRKRRPGRPRKKRIS